MSDFLAMGGYGFYVWTSYGFFLAALAWSTLAPMLRKRSVLQRLADRAARDRRKQEAD